MNLRKFRSGDVNFWLPLAGVNYFLRERVRSDADGGQLVAELLRALGCQLTGEFVGLRERPWAECSRGGGRRCSAPSVLS